MSDINQKLLDVLTASDAKKAALAGIQQTQAEVPAPTPAPQDKSNTFVQSLYDNDIIRQGNSLAGLANYGAIAAGAFSRGIGEIASILPTVVGAVGDSPSDNAAQAMQRKRVGTATQADLDLLALPSGWNEKKPYMSLMEHQAFKSGKFETNEQALTRKEDANAYAEKIRENSDMSARIDQTNNTALQGQLKDVYADSKKDINKGNYVSGALGAVSGALGAGVDNPGATLGLVVDQAFNIATGLATGGVGTAIKAAGYGTRTYNEGIAEKMKANEGMLPSAEERAKSAASATAAAALDVVGDAAMLGAGRALKGVLPGTAKLGAEITEEALKGGAASAIAKATKSLTAPAMPVLKGAAGESGTEAAQTYFEEAAKGKDATGEDMFVAGAMGGLVGGGIRGVVGATSNLANLATKVQEKQVEDAKAKETEVAAVDTFKKAVADKDVSAFTDDSKDTFAPNKAIDALRSISKENKQDSDIRAANLAQAETIRSEVADEFDATKNAINLKDNPEALTKFKEDLAKENADFEGYKEAFKNDPETLKEVEVEQAKVNKQAERSILLAERESKEALNDKLIDYNTLNKKTTESVGRIRNDFGSKDEAAAALTRLANTKAGDADSDATTNVVLRLAMTSPGKLSKEKVASLVSDTSNALTPQGRDYLTAWVEAREATDAVNSMENVSNAVVHGDKATGFVGVNTYRTNITNSINENKSLKTQRDVDALGKWANYYTEKNAAVKEAYAMAKQDGGNHYPTPNADGTWTVEDTASKGSLDIHRGSNKSGLVDRIEAESKLVSATHKELSSAINVKRALNAARNTSTPTSPATDTTVAQGQGAQRSEQPASPEAKESGKSVSNKTNNTTTSTIPTTRVVESKSLPSSQDSLVSGVETVNRSSLDTTNLVPQTKTSLNATPKATSVSKEEEGGVNLRPSTAEVAGLTDAVQPTDAVVDSEGEDRGVQDGQTQAEALSPDDTNPQISVLKDPDNYFAQQFTQKAAAETESNPLLAIKDFITTWTKNPTVVEAFLPMNTFIGMPEAVKAVEKATNHFRKSIISLNNKIQGNLARPKTRNKFKGKDPIQDLMIEVTQADGTIKLDLDENVKSAISAAAYSYILDSVNKQNNTDNAIADMHGAEVEELNISPSNDALFRNTLGFRHAAIDGMGKAVTKALGLKPSAIAGQEAMPLLETAFGVHAYQALEAAGAIVTTEVPLSTADAWLFGTPMPEKESKETNSYVTLAKEGAGAEWNTQVRNANKGTGQIVNKILDKEKISKAVARTAQKFTQKNLKKSSLSVPAITAKVLQKEMNEPWTVVPEMYKAMQLLGKENILKLAGFMTVDKLHTINQESAQAQNDNLEKQYDFLDEELHSPLNNDGVNTEFFVTAEAWKNHRAGIATQSINPQTSKLHRFIMQKNSWRNSYDFRDSEQMEQFMLAVAAMSGAVKTDAQSDAESLALFDTKRQDPKFIKATDAAKKILKDEKPSADEATALTELARDGEGTQSLQAMLAYAAYQNALDAGDSSFQATLGVGVDGKTNGPILSMLANGAADTVEGLLSLMERGGLFNKNSPFKSFNTWYGTKTKNDLYQHLAVLVFNKAKEDRRNKPKLEALEFFTGDFIDDIGRSAKAGRNAIKTPLTSFNFGSSVYKSAEGMKEGFIEAIYKSIQKAAAGPKDKHAAYIANFVSNINTLTGSKFKASDFTMEDLMTKTLFPTKGFSSLGFNRDNFDKSYFFTVGKPLSETFEKEFATYISRRDSLTNAANQIFALYSAVYQEKKAEYINKLMDEGKLAFTTATSKNRMGEKVPERDLTSKEEKGLMESMQQYVPITPSIFSILSQKKSDGLYLGKSAFKKADGAMYVSAVTTKNGTTRQPAVSLQGSAPGAAAMPYNMHSYDSSIMKFTQAMVDEVLNVHDEGTTGLIQVQDMARALNMNTIKGFYEFSPITETIGRLASMVSTLRHDVAAGRLSPVVYSKFLENSKFNNAENVDDLINTVLSAYNIKSGALRQITDVDQYTYETGTYTVTAKDMEQLEASLAKEKLMIDIAVKQLRDSTKSLDKVLEDAKEQDMEYLSVMDELNDVVAEQEAEDSAADVKTAEDLNLTDGVANVVVEVLLTQRVNNTPSTTDPMTKIQESMAKKPSEGLVGAVNALGAVDRASAVESLSKAGRAIPASLVSPFGELGNTSNETNEAMAAKLAANPVMDKAGALGVLRGLVNAMPEGNKKSFYKQIFIQIRTALPDNTRLIYLTPDYKGEVDVAFGNNEAAYTSIDKNKTDIYVLSSDHKYGAVNFEMLMHEMVHATIARTIEDASNPDVVELVNNLKGIMKKAEKAAEGMPEFAPAFANIHEFVSWGMSNMDFQDKVLSTFTVKAANSKNPFIKAIVEFANTLRGILFGKKTSTSSTVNGFNQFIKNTTALVEASKSQPSAIKMSLAMTTAASPVKEGYDRELANIVDAVIEANADKNSPAFNAKLRELTLRTSLGGLGLDPDTVKAYVENSPKTSLDIYEQMREDGVLSSPDAFTVGLPFSPQEALAADNIQAVMEHVLSRKNVPSDMSFRMLQRAYESARTQMTAADFLPKGKTAANAFAGDMAVAQATYDSVFNTSDGQYLSRFVAVALANETMNEKLRALPELAKEAPKTMMDKLLGFLNQALEYVRELFTGTRDTDNTADRIDALVRRLARNEVAARESEIAKQSAEDSLYEQGRDFLDKTLDTAIDKTGKALKESGNAFVKLAGNTLYLTGGDRAKFIVKAARRARDKSRQARDGFVSSLFTEVVGTSKQFEAMLRMTKGLEKARMATKTNVAKFLLDGFARKDYTESEFKSMTNVFLRTDAQALANDYTVEELRDIYKDSSKLDAAIALETNALKGTKLTNFYLGQAKTLGMYLATEKVTSEFMLQNAHSIVRALGTDQKGKVAATYVNDMEPVIDRLVSLYAIKYSNPAEVAEAVKIFDQEIARKSINPEDQGNGVWQLLKTHEAMQQDSRERLFQGAEALMSKGYLPEVTDPNVSITTATTKDEGIELVKQGWTKLNSLSKANNDPRAVNTSIYFRKDGGLSRHETALLGYTDSHGKGSKIGKNNSYIVKAAAWGTNTSASSMFMGNFDPTKVKGNFMVPSINPEGEVVNFAYRMNKATRDNILNRDNRPHVLLGTFASGVQDKVDTTQNNNEVIDALRAQYELEGAVNADAFIEFSANSKESFIKEHWYMLPEATRKHIEATWDGPMYVRADMFNLVFGSRMPSIGDIFNKPVNERNAREKVIASTLEKVVKSTYFLTKAARGNSVSLLEAGTFAEGQTEFRVRQAEKMWQEVVAHLKQNIVIRNVDVALGNISSNVSLLMLAGVNPVDIYKYHVDAVKAAEDYQKHTARKMEIEAALESGFMPTGQHGLEAELMRINDAINRNPAKPLMDAGLMPTIVEDVETGSDPYSYKSKLTKAIEKKVSKLPKGITEVGKQVLMTEDTKSFKFLNRSAQLSDFIARYTLVQHTMNRKKNPLSQEDAISFASEAFINYDLPSHRYLNYANSVGLVMFTKYYLRIQKTIMYLAKEHPGRALAMQVAHSYMSGMPILFDSFFTGKLGRNPLTTGIFQYPGTVGSLTTVQGLTYPFK